MVSFCTRLCCVELYPAAAEENKKITFDKLRVYGLLTNAVVFDFHSYDPITKQFCFDERMLISPVRSDALAGMVNGAYFFFPYSLRANVPSL